MTTHMLNFNMECKHTLGSNHVLDVKYVFHPLWIIISPVEIVAFSYGIAKNRLFQNRGRIICMDMPSEMHESCEQMTKVILCLKNFLI